MQVAFVPRYGSPDVVDFRELPTPRRIPGQRDGFPFERITDAYRVVDSGRKKGSVVVTLDARSSAR
jgi:hypothetical protein